MRSSWLPELSGSFFPSWPLRSSSVAQGAFLGLVSLVVIAGVALLFTFIPRVIRNKKIRGILSEGEHETSQTSLRWTIVLLFALLVIAADFGLDVVLGAFLAGVVLRRWAPGDVHSLEGKLDAVGYGFFIPVFFVASGMSLDLQSIIKSPARLVVFFVLFLVVRGLPAVLFYRRDLPVRGRVQLMLLTATAFRCLLRWPISVSSRERCCPRTPPHSSARVCSQSWCSPRLPSGLAVPARTHLWRPRAARAADHQPLPRHEANHPAQCVPTSP